MTDPITLDAGALVAVDRGEHATWSDLKTMVRAGSIPVIPTPVVVQTWRGARQGRLGQLLRLCHVEPLDETTARRAGELCGRAGTADPVDAVVIVSASRRGGIVLTSDAGDLARLVSHLGPGHRPLAVRDVASAK
ncbi:MAG: PIN domain-containing protein [Actinobacteria bacterium]|nr:PIN domain-containing protein [Actinomycetota bacterium]